MHKYMKVIDANQFTLLYCRDAEASGLSVLNTATVKNTQSTCKYNAYLVSWGLN